MNKKWNTSRKTYDHFDLIRKMKITKYETLQYRKRDTQTSMKCTSLKNTSNNNYNNLNERKKIMIIGRYIKVRNRLAIYSSRPKNALKNQWKNENS